MRTIGKWNARSFLGAVAGGLLVLLVGAWYLGQWALARYERNPASVEYRTLLGRVATTANSISRQLAGTRLDLQIAHRASPLPPPPDENEAVETNAAGATAEGAAQLPRLTAILWSTNRPIAILNNVEVTAGDEVAGYHVMEIRQQSVQVKDTGGTIMTLLLYE
jgi:hypothetical protein